MKLCNLALAVGLVGLAGGVQAALVLRDAGMVYDDVLDITWAPANLWGTTGTWDQAVAWAAGLAYGGFEDWRLASMSVSAGLPTGATTNPVDCGVAPEVQCRDNEVGYMFRQNLGGSRGVDLTGDQGPFTDIQPFYWSGTEWSSRPRDALGFLFGFGVLDLYDKSAGGTTAWAVRAGDVAAVPLPGTAVLMALGLLGLGADRRMRRVTKTLR